MPCFSLAGDQGPPSSASLFYSGPCLNDVHFYWGGPSALLSPPAQMLILSGNNLIDTPRNYV